jgi:methyltransferase (TIGR00027 family)
LRDGFAQVAILDAGLDSRAWRLRPRFQNRRVIELDDAASQAAKRLRVETVLGPSPPFLTYAAFQAQRGDLAETLRAAGLRPLERAFFIWEGASVYYTEAAARRTLRAVAQTAAPGSRLAMDFVPASQVARVNRDPASPQARWDASWGHPWSFGVPDAAPQGFFRDLGFQARDVLDTNGEEAARRYLTRRDGTVFGPPPNAPGTGLESYLRRVLVELVVPD